MSSVLRRALMALSGLVLTNIAQASDYRFSAVSASGSGCPSGSASITFSPDNKVVSVIFDQFSVQVPSANGALAHNKSCTLKVSATLPAGVAIDGLTVSADYRGFVAVEPGAEAGLALYTSPFRVRSLASSSSLQIAPLLRLITRKFAPKDYVSIDEEWQHTFTRFLKAPVSCSNQQQTVSFNLHTDAYARIVGPNDLGAFAFLTVDSSDLAGGLKFKFNSRFCAAQLKLPDINLARIPLPHPLPLKIHAP